MSRAAPVCMTAEQMGYTKQNFCWLHVFESPAFGLYMVDRGMTIVLPNGASRGIRNGVTGWLTGADGAPFEASPLKSGPHKRGTAQCNPQLLCWVKGGWLRNACGFIFKQCLAARAA